MTDIPVIEANLGRCDTLRAYPSVSALGNAMKLYTGRKRPYRCEHCRNYHLGWTDADKAQELHARIEHAMSYGKR